MRPRIRILMTGGLAACALMAGGFSAHAAPASTAATARSVPQCRESQLRASIDPKPILYNNRLGAGGGVNHAVLVDFKNKSKRTCTLRGYPGAAIVGFDGSQVQQARRTTGIPYGGTPVRTVKLKPKSSAAAYIAGAKSRKPGNCGERYPRILVTPPNTALPVGFTVGWPNCFSFVVHPVQLRSKVRYEG